MRAWRRVVLHRRVIINLVDGSAIEGVIWAEEGPLLVLRGAMVHENGQRADMDGEVVVDKAQIRFAQVMV